jgi:GNAT superfamily N-acetyltransferase
VLERLSTPAEIDAATGSDLLFAHLRPHLVLDQPSWRFGDAACVPSDYWDAVGYQAGGPPGHVARLLTALVHEGRDITPSLPEAALGHVDPAIVDPSHEGTPWAFRWTDALTGAAGGDGEWLAASDEPAITAFLADHFPDTSAPPGNRHVQRWAGIRDGGGDLLAVAADCTEAAGVGFIASIASRHDLRGTGLGRRITGWLTDRLIEDHGVAALWHYGDNVVASALYDALGYADDHRMTSARFRPPPGST